MTYIVKDECIKCKLTDCVEVCPVDCFYEGENMLVINPDECIDCGVCEPECPVDAIHSDTDPNIEKWAELNRIYSEKWPNINIKKTPPTDSLAFAITSTINFSNSILDFLEATNVITIAYTTATSSLNPPTDFKPKWIFDVTTLSISSLNNSFIIAEIVLLIA